MKQNKEYPEWFLWIWERGGLVFIGGGLLFVATMIAFALFLDSRIEQVEDRLSYAPPRSYETPKLEDYDAGEINVAELPARQLVYVPVYSHVYYQGGSPYLLETTLSIRNTDVDQPIYLLSVNYFDTSGKRIKSHLDRTIKLAPLQTVEFLVQRRDSSGGSGANFLVEWRGEQRVDKPIVEAVMVGATGTQGICFGRSGIEIAPANNANEVER